MAAPTPSSPRRLPSWALNFGLLVLLMALPAGLKAELLGRVQQALLATGFWRPATEVLANRQPLPDLPLLTLDGKAANLRDFRGKVVFLNLWASWCGPCRGEMPGIQRLYDQVDHSKVAFVMLSLDKKQEAAQRVITKEHYTFPVYVNAGSMPAEFNVSSIPTTFIIDTEGRLASRVDGMAEYDSPKFRAFLQKLSQ
jgi:thiol-disulfide isomerase/thioredoxin